MIQLLRRGNKTVIHRNTGDRSSKQWQPLSERLRPRYRVLAPDLYGYGTSLVCDTGRPCSLDDEAALIEPLLDGIPQGVYLVGHSYGAAVALKLALAYRERIHGLVLCEPTLFGLLFAEKPAHRAAMEIGVARLTIRRYLRAGKRFLAAQRFVDYWSGEGTWRSLPPRSRRPSPGACRQCSRTWTPSSPMRHPCRSTRGSTRRYSA